MSQIKSKKRVSELAEVYTNEREVEAMLDLVKLDSYNIDKTFLEPSCGNGNFIIAIIHRKLSTITDDKEFNLIKVISSVYGIDICENNVQETKQRVYDFLSEFMDISNISKQIWHILNQNIILGDTINKPENITIVEYSFENHSICENLHNFKNLLEHTNNIFDVKNTNYINYRVFPNRQTS